LEISGFFDVVGNYQSSADDKTSFGLGKAEVNLENQLTDKTVASVAIAYKNETGGFELGAATLEFNLYGNFVAYGVNGFESSYIVSDAAHALTPSLSIGDEVNTTPASAFDAHGGFNPVDGLEVGGSFALGMNQDCKSEMQMFGGDLQYNIADFCFKGEYIEYSLNRSIEEETNKGYYVRALYNINQVFLTGRYGACQPDGAAWVDRYSIGVGYEMADVLGLRFGTTINKNSNDNTDVLQLAGGF